MKLKAYAKVNLILNVLGTRPDGYHEVRMLMQAISLHDVVTVEAPCGGGSEAGSTDAGAVILTPADFEYGEKDLAWRAALLMAETFRPELLVEDAAEPGAAKRIGIRGVRISIEKHIPAAAGLAGGSADAASVLIGLARLWNLMKVPAVFAPKAPGSDVLKALGSSAIGTSAINDELFVLLSPLAAELGSDVPFCLASQLGHTAAIASGRGTELEFVAPTDCGVDLFFSGAAIPNKTRAVYAELRPEDCTPVYDIEAFLAAVTLAEKQALMGNHLQAPAERLIRQLSENPDHALLSGVLNPQGSGCPALPAGCMLCGAGPTYFRIGEEGQFRTLL